MEIAENNPLVSIIVISSWVSYKELDKRMDLKGIIKNIKRKK